MEQIRKFNKSPLIQVIIQLRYPSILDISTNEPVEFQNRIRDSFPVYNKRNEVQKQIVINKNTNADSNPNSYVPQLLETNTPNHQFSSESSDCSINLTNTFISITTTNYSSFATLMYIFMPIVEAMIDIYSPAFFSRIGLRYIDAISRKKYNKENSEWTSLISSSALGMLANERYYNNVTGLQNISEIYLSDKCSARLISSLGTLNNAPDDKCFIFDSDIFTKTKTDKNIDAIKTQLNELHDYSFSIFESIITQEMRVAMEPNE